MLTKALIIEMTHNYVFTNLNSSFTSMCLFSLFYLYRYVKHVLGIRLLSSMLESFTIKNPRNLGSTKQATTVWLIKEISDSRKMIKKSCTMDHRNLDCLLSTDVGNHGYGDSLWYDAKYGYMN